MFDENEKGRKSEEEGKSLAITTFLCQCDPVVLQKDDFQPVANHWIVVDHLANGGDQADDHLGCVVTWSSLRGRVGEKG